MSVVIPDREIVLRPDDGYFSEVVDGLSAGISYRYRIDDGGSFPDPVSRFQPEGPHRNSAVVDPNHFPWTDGNWSGVPLKDAVIYELHIGTFTAAGTWDAAAKELPYLRDLGITVIEVMPVAEFPGKFGWGYDGVHLFAPTRLYGRPDDFRRFVDDAHRCGLGVILDVVYNHLGPDGNYLRQFSDRYFTPHHRTDWGEALNFDGEGRAGVRTFFIENAVHWIREYHLDGLRLDATHSIFDDSEAHILATIAEACRKAAGKRTVLLTAENDHLDPKLITAHQLDAVWNDDFHHSARVAVSGRSEGYYSSYRGTPQELISAVKHGYLYQGQRNAEGKQRGTATASLPPEHFITFLENHDQVANSAHGEHVYQLTDMATYRAMTALLLLAPGTPLLFQGQEFASSRPFPYFADHSGDLGQLVRNGRAAYLAQFPSLATAEMQAALDDPGDGATFEAAKLDWAERDRNPQLLEMFGDLLRLRKQMGPLVDGAVLGDRAFVLRFGPAQQAKLLLVNLGSDLHLGFAAEPLLGGKWQTVWSSEYPRYGGRGAADAGDNWHIAGKSAALLSPI